MARGRAAVRRDVSHDLPPMVARRQYMELLHTPVQTSSKRSHSSSRPPPHKRPRTSPPTTPSPSSEQQSVKPAPSLHPDPRAYNLLYVPNRLFDLDRLGLDQHRPHLVVNVNIPAEYLVSTAHPLKARQLWGSPPDYTDDSDLIAVLQQTGHFQLPPTPPDWLDYLVVSVSLTRHATKPPAPPKAKKQDASPPTSGSTSIPRPFIGRAVNGVVSRSWSSSYDGARMRVLATTAMRAGYPVPLPPPRQGELRIRTPSLVPWNAPSARPRSSAPDAAPGSPDRGGHSSRPGSPRAGATAAAGTGSRGNTGTDGANGVAMNGSGGNTSGGNAGQTAAASSGHGSGQARASGGAGTSHGTGKSGGLTSGAGAGRTANGGAGVGNDAENGGSANVEESGGAVHMALGAGVTFDMLNEPCLPYDLKEVTTLAPRGNLCNRLAQSGETVYLENGHERFEISAVPRAQNGISGHGDGDDEEQGAAETAEDGRHETIRVRVGRVLPKALRRARLAKAGFASSEGEGANGWGGPGKRRRNDGAAEVPLAAQWLDVLAHDCLASDIVWDAKGFTVGGRHFRVDKMSFVKGDDDE